MAHKLQMVYFPVRARAEACRMAMAYGNLQWEDVSYKTLCPGASAWPDAKKFTPWDQLPVLIVDETIHIAQSGAILRFIANIAGNLVPPDHFKAAQVDATYAAACDLTSTVNINPIVNVYKGETFASKKNDFFAVAQGKLAVAARNLATTTGPFFFGDAPFYCDFEWYHVLDLIRQVDPSAVDAHPVFAKLIAAVEALPGVAEYLAGRPECVDIGVKPMLREKSSMQ